MSGTRKLLENIRTTQDQLATQVESIAIGQKQLQNAQNDISECLVSLIHRSHEGLRLTRAVRRLGHVLDAGPRLVNTAELLEMILLGLSPRKILLSRRVNSLFKGVIARSPLLQRKLFFSQEPVNLHRARIVVNPILTRASVLARFPIWFDPSTTRLAYCHRNARQRLRCCSVTVSGGSEKVWIEMAFELEPDPEPFSRAQDSKPPLGAGSWRHMYLSQPSCNVKWRFTKREGCKRQTYSGFVTGEHTLDKLLEALAESATNYDEEPIVRHAIR